ncbi:glycosyltransferase [candidate division KSB3 bacterium]|nr:glycosyltransferase [candidate division KSB3 bacterium]
MRKLVLFSYASLDEMLRKGNAWYVRHYESYFDEVYVIYLLGQKAAQVQNGATRLISLGSGRGIWDLFFSPWRIFRFARRVKPTAYLTADIIFSWWAALLIRGFLHAKIVLMPVCMPDNIYLVSGKSLSGLPRRLEKVFTWMSFCCADQVITGKNITVYREWLSSMKFIRNKLNIVNMLVDELPSIEFYEELISSDASVETEKDNVLLYVGRLHAEKMVGDLIEMFKLVSKRYPRMRLKIIGDGPARPSLLVYAQQLGVATNIDFLPSKSNKDLVNHYKKAAMFVSPLTGTALREAALCRLPIVAYKIDWVLGFLKDKENAMVMELRDVQGMADAVLALLSDSCLAERIASSLHQYALDVWGQGRIKAALEQIFGSNGR